MGKKIKNPYMIEDLEILDTLVDGRGIGKLENQAVFVRDVVPGDIIDAWAFRKEKGSIIADLRELKKPSELRQDAVCAHFEECGGCKWQNFKYEGQLFHKEKQVVETIKRVGNVEPGECRPILGLEEPYWYRNKLEFTFSNKRWIPKSAVESGEKFDTPNALGYHVSNVFFKVLDIDKCHLQIPIVNDIRNEVRNFTLKEEIPYYDIVAHTGFLRNLVFRTTSTGELMVLLLVNEDKPEIVNQIFSHLEPMFPQVTSWVWIHNPKFNSSYSDLTPIPWKGNPWIEEQLGKWKYRISPTSFFQTNSGQAKVLYDVIKEMVGPKTGTIYDLYAGAGTIGIYLSELADKVVGIEYVEASVKDAAINLELNGLSHLSFFAGNMKDMLTDEWVNAHGRPDVIVSDPPRAGMDKSVVMQLLEIECPRIIYVSCKPSTQARDIEILSAKYDLKAIQPVDMFPHTSHIENVALLELRGPS